MNVEIFSQILSQGSGPRSFPQGYTSPCQRGCPSPSQELRAGGGYPREDSGTPPSGTGLPPWLELGYTPSTGVPPSPGGRTGERVLATQWVVGGLSCFVFVLNYSLLGQYSNRLANHWPFLFCYISCQDVGCLF